MPYKGIVLVPELNKKPTLADEIKRLADSKQAKRDIRSRKFNDKWDARRFKEKAKKEEKLLKNFNKKIYPKVLKRIKRLAKGPKRQACIGKIVNDLWSSYEHWELAGMIAKALEKDGFVVEDAQSYSPTVKW